MQEPRTAILYFAFRAEKEAERKPLFKEYGAAADLRFYKHLQSDREAMVAQLGLPFVHWHEGRQCEGGFAERIVHALSSCFEEGFSRVLVIGNDSPEMNTAHVQRALDVLSVGENYLIRDQRGGAALIGVTKESFRAEVWTDLEWQSERTFNELFDVLPNCQVHSDVLLDINQIADAFQYLEIYRFRTELGMILGSLLMPLIHGETWSAWMPRSAERPSAGLRGPPYSC